MFILILLLLIPIIAIAFSTYLRLYLKPKTKKVAKEIDPNKRLSNIFMIFVSIQTIIMGIIFIIQILRIYYGNNKEFTSEICGKYVLQILPVIIIWILLIVLSYIYFRKSKIKENHTSKMTNIGKLKLFEYMCPEYKEGLNEELYKILSTEKRQRKTAWIINTIIIALCSLMGLMYLLNVEHFKSEGNLSEQAIQMTIHLIPWVIISFISTLGLMLYQEKSAYKSVEVIKLLIKANGKKINNYVENNKKKKIILITRIGIIVIAIGLIIHGIINGGANDVLQKAINICTECIGLG